MTSAAEMSREIVVATKKKWWQKKSPAEKQAIKISNLRKKREANLLKIRRQKQQELQAEFSRFEQSMIKEIIEKILNVDSQSIRIYLYRDSSFLLINRETKIKYLGDKGYPISSSINGSDYSFTFNVEEMIDFLETKNNNLF